MTKLQIFQNEVGKWVSFLGLQDWRWEVVMSDGIQNRAQVTWDAEGRIVLVQLSSEWVTKGDDVGKPNDNSIRQTARHEVFEVLLADLKEIMIKWPQDNAAIATETHRIIRRLEAITE